MLFTIYLNNLFILKGDNKIISFAGNTVIYNYRYENLTADPLIYNELEKGIYVKQTKTNSKWETPVAEYLVTTKSVTIKKIPAIYNEL